MMVANAETRWTMSRGTNGAAGVGEVAWDADENGLGGLAVLEADPGEQPWGMGAPSPVIPVMDDGKKFGEGVEGGTDEDEDDLGESGTAADDEGESDEDSEFDDDDDEFFDDEEEDDDDDADVDEDEEDDF